MNAKVDELMRLVDAYADEFADGIFGESDAGATREALRAAIEAALKPVEPVAEVYQKMTGGNSFPGTAIRWLDTAPLLPAGAQLYTAPPAQTPPPRLTDEQVKKLGVLPGTVRAIESAVRKQAGWEE